MATTTETQLAHLKPEELSWHARWASIAIREQLEGIQQQIKALPNPEDNKEIKARNQLAPLAGSQYHKDHMPPDAPKGRKYKVGIIGAGVAGLFTGMIFDHLKEEPYNLDVEYEILESNEDERLGGRLYTHYFNDQKENPHDYYDVGAMRFPDSKIMARVFALFDNELGMKKNTDVKNAAIGELVPYYLSGEKTTELYNDVLVVNETKSSQSTANSFKVTGLPEEQANKRPGDIIEEQVQHFTDKFQTNPEEGWKYLMETGDKFSVREWLLQKLDFDTTEWLETYSYGTSWYDEALSEMVLEELNFSHTGDWYCVMGGSQEIARRMCAKVEEKKAGRVHFGKKVTKIDRLATTQEVKPGGDAPLEICINVAGETESRKYNAVFNSAPLGNMQRMDLRGLNLNWGTKQAIRSLGYGASCKIGIRFNTLWWIEHGIKKGGASKTDQPIRNCVYPSYNIEDPVKKPGVLLASYTWSQEAQRIGTLINDKTEAGYTELKALLIDNLARLHSSTQAEHDKIRAVIEENYDTHFAYDWYTDPGTTGAFAYFGPGQFRNMYPYIIRNDGTHIIIGEAASAHHAWVVGALESAVRGVYQFLFKHSKYDKVVDKVLQAYNSEEIGAPWGPVPAEFDRTEDVIPLGVEDPKLLKKAKASPVGEWLRQGVLIEDWRLEQKSDRLDPSKVEKDQVADFVTVNA